MKRTGFPGTWQAANSDWGKQASRVSPKRWGGRYADGVVDARKPASFFLYLTTHHSERSGKKVYKYGTSNRKLWPTYGKKYTLRRGK